MDPDSLGGLAIENARVAAVPGTSTVTDLITVKPPVSPEKVQAVIEDAFKREAEIDARHISVEVSDHAAKLYGHVHPLHEAAAARAAPGVATVESHLLASRPSAPAAPPAPGLLSGQLRRSIVSEAAAAPHPQSS